MPRRNFRHLVVASGLSNLADGVFQITLPLVALGITRDPAAFASVTLVGRLPWLLFSLPAGALADRLDRRRTMTLVDLGRALVIAGLAASSRPTSRSCGCCTSWPSGSGSARPCSTRPPSRSCPTSSTTRTALGGQRPALRRRDDRQPVRRSTVGGLIAGTASPALSPQRGGVRPRAGAAAPRGHFRPFRDRATDAMRPTSPRASATSPAIACCARSPICVGISNLASTAMFAVFPLYAVEPGPMGLSGAGFGLLLTTLAVGSVIGSLVAERTRAPLGRRRTLLLARHLSRCHLGRR